MLHLGIINTWLWSISFPELRSPWPAVGKRELWEQPFWNNKGNNRSLVIRMTAILAPRAHDHSDLRKGSRALAGPDFLSVCRVIVSYSQPISESRTSGVGQSQSSRSLPQVRRIVALGTRMDDCADCIYSACLKWLLPELSFSDRWSRGTKLWERDWIVIGTPCALTQVFNYNILWLDACN